MNQVFQLKAGTKPLTFHHIGNKEYMVGVRKIDVAMDLSRRLPNVPKLQYKHVSFVDADESLYQQLYRLGVDPEKAHKLEFSRGILLMETTLSETAEPSWYVYPSHLYTYTMMPIEKKAGVSFINKKIEDNNGYSAYDVFTINAKSFW